MPRRETAFIAGYYYHIYNRGNNREGVFFEVDNYVYFLRGIKKYLRPVADVMAYCLMPTHYHLLIRVKRAGQTSEVLKTSEVSNVSRAMQKLSISYTKAINKRFDRVGSLFQGAFQAKHIQNRHHLCNLCVYIHANPVKDGLVACVEDWPYSNYPEWLGERNGTLVDPAFIQAHFDSPTAYKALIAEYIKTRALPDAIRAYLQLVEG